MHDVTVRGLDGGRPGPQMVIELPERRALSMIIPTIPLCRGLGLLDALTGEPPDGGAAAVDQPVEGSTVVVESVSDDGSTVAHSIAVASTDGHAAHAAVVSHTGHGDHVMRDRHIIWPCSGVLAHTEHDRAAL